MVEVNTTLPGIAALPDTWLPTERLGPDPFLQIGVSLSTTGPQSQTGVGVDTLGDGSAVYV